MKGMGALERVPSPSQLCLLDCRASAAQLKFAAKLLCL